jgi:hypothetical protein
MLFSINQHHRLSRWYEEGPLKGPLVEFQLTLVLVPLKICWLRGAPPDLALINPGGAHAWSTTTGAPTEQRPFVCQRSRRIRCTQGTAEPIGVLPPEAVDLFLINVSLWDLKSLAFRRPLPVCRAQLVIELASTMWVVVMSGKCKGLESFLVQQPVGLSADY